MSLKRLAVVSAVGSHNSFNNQTISYISSYSGSSGSVEQGLVGHAGSGTLRTGGHHQGLQTMRPGANLHGNVNIMLGGAMLSVVITVVCFVCYCCHRNIKKRSNSIYRQQWLETEANMEIYSVEQCYDPPPSGGFFMDGGGSAGDYQSLPMVTSSINHTTHHPQYPYHHQHYQQQQQQQPLQHHYQYAPYPNGPPPSYDTVVAQDELLANVARRKRNFPGVAGPSDHGCPDPDSPDCDKHSPCTGVPLLPKTASGRSPRRCGGTAAQYRRNDDMEHGDPAEEPLCRSMHHDGVDWPEDVREHPGEGDPLRGEVSCSCTSGNSLTPGQLVQPIYCRNCGYFVEGSRDVRASSHSPALSSDRIEPTHNETLLVDYGTTAGAPGRVRVPHQTGATTGPGNDINRNNVIDDSGNTAIVDIDTPTMQTTAASPGSTVDRIDTVNNNATNEIGDCTARGPSNVASSGASSAVNATVVGENNNIITDSSPGSAALVERRRLISPMDHRDGFAVAAAAADDDDVIHQCPNMSKTMSNQCNSHPRDATIGTDHRYSPGRNLHHGSDGNGNPDPGTSPAPPETGLRNLLDENGLVRLDMSQIIDNTGLPTYEAALKLESSGYV